VSDDEPSDIDLVMLYVRLAGTAGDHRGACRKLYEAGRSFERERGAAWKDRPDVPGIWFSIWRGHFECFLLTPEDLLARGARQTPDVRWYGPIPADPKDPK